ncbi:uncharacterized protein LOC62_05G007621 [Vanrija pseudolonga]|uniref:Uncharacterized protein n=1 Tax=Vanrija pseudolonga TaxID=143232 RepID=A0AAF0YHM1_9TREE|nr:hypothetical protein LOC62_05G007621 [Vanrija pseudolonga]
MSVHNTLSVLYADRTQYQINAAQASMPKHDGLLGSEPHVPRRWFVLRSGDVRRALDSTHGRASHTYRVEVLRQYLITKELNGYTHDKAGLLAKLHELEQSYGQYPEAFQAAREQFGLGLSRKPSSTAEKAIKIKASLHALLGDGPSTPSDPTTRHVHFSIPRASPTQRTSFELWQDNRPPGEYNDNIPNRGASARSIPPASSLVGSGASTPALSESDGDELDELVTPPIPGSPAELSSDAEIAAKVARFTAAKAEIDHWLDDAEVEGTVVGAFAK